MLKNRVSSWWTLSLCTKITFCPTPLQCLCEVAGYWRDLEPRCCTRRSRASQTCSMSDMSGDYVGHGRIGSFSPSRICGRSLQHGAVHYYPETWGDGGGWMAWQWGSGSRHGIRGTLFTKLTSSNRSVTWRHTLVLLLWGHLEVLPNSLKRRWRL